MPTVQCGHPGNLALLTRLGPALTVSIGSPHRSAIPLSAMLDTGANINCIETSLAVSLELPVVDVEGEVKVVGSGGMEKQPVYFALVSIPALNVDEEPEPFHSVGDLQAIRPHQIVLGRPFLEKYRLAYDGRTGSVIISNDP